MENDDHFSKVSLVPIHCSDGQVTENLNEKCSLSDIVAKERQKSDNSSKSNTNNNNTNPDITLVFLIRRAGCGGCRENGQIISKLVNENINNTNISCIGILKEINVDNSALIEFYEKYFNFPLYVDRKRKLYELFGNCKITLYNLLTNTPASFIRYYKKKITNIPFGGDIFIQGGILFYCNGTLFTKYYEKYGEPFDITSLRAIVRNMKQKIQSENNSSTGIDTSDYSDSNSYLY